MLRQYVAEMDAHDVRIFFDCAASYFISDASGDSLSYQSKAHYSNLNQEIVMGTDLLSMTSKDLSEILGLSSDFAHSIVQFI